jgi:hypothetical protein
MANTIKLKRSSVAGKVPLTSDLDYGEVSINYTDGTLYYKDSSGAINTIGSNIGNTVVSGNITANTAGTRATFANVTTTNGIFWANGVNYSTGLGGSSTYSNSNVTALLSANTVTTISTTGNITGGNLVTVGQVTATGNVNVTGNVNIGNANSVSWANAAGIRAYTYYNNAVAGLDTVFL